MPSSLSTKTFEASRKSSWLVTSGRAAAIQAQAASIEAKDLSKLTSLGSRVAAQIKPF